MSPPTSIDGTDITGATIDGTDVTEITVDGQTVFTAVQLSDIDGFETGNINNYTGDTAGFVVQSTEVFEGSNALQCNSGRITTNNPPGGTLPSFGTDFEFHWYVPSSSTDVEPQLSYESDGSDAQGYLSGYAIVLQERKDEFGIFGAETGDINGFGNDFQSISNYRDKWLKLEVTHSGSTVTVEMIDTTNQSSFGSVSLNQFSTNGNLLGFNTEKVNSPDLYYLDSIRTI